MRSASHEVFIQGGPPDTEPAGHLSLGHAIRHPPPGLGDLGIRYGYQRFLPEVMAAVVLVLIVLVQIVQSLGDRLARKLNKRAIGTR